jgi:hypothetical protein
VKGETVVYPVRRWKSRFGHQVTSHVSPEWRGLHPLADSFGTHANIFLNKKIEKKTWKIPKHLMNLLITQNMKIAPKTKLIFFFVFSKVKNMFSLYMNHGKIINTPTRQLNKFLISGSKKKNILLLSFNWLPAPITTVTNGKKLYSYPVNGFQL